MATMSTKLRQAMLLALGETWDTEFETILDTTTLSAVSAGMEAKIRNWLADDTLAVELIAALENSEVAVSVALRDRIHRALGDDTIGNELVTLINAITVRSSTPSATTSHTPSPSPSSTQSPSATASNTPSGTPSRTPSATGT